MFPGTRFYFDRNGRYRGKASDYGPITHGIWTMAGVALVGYLVVEWLTTNWWWIALIGAFAIGFVSVICLLTGRSFAACSVGMAISMAAVAALFVLQPIITAQPSKPVRAGTPAEDTEPVLLERRPIAPAKEDAEVPVQNVQEPAPVMPQAMEKRDVAPPPEGASEIARPSFNCQMATQNAEQIVCSNRGLSKRDADVDALYRQAKAMAADPLALRQSQRNWLYYERNACRTTSCLERVYEERKEYLGRLAGQ